LLFYEHNLESEICLLDLCQRGEKQDKDARDRHQVRVQAEATNSQLCAIIRAHHWSYPQDGIEPESQSDHSKDQEVLDQHGNTPDVTEIHKSQVTRVNQHKIRASNDEDQQGGI
jgi:hypothetical protein